MFKREPVCCSPSTMVFDNNLYVAVVCPLHLKANQWPRHGGILDGIVYLVVSLDKYAAGCYLLLLPECYQAFFISCTVVAVKSSVSLHEPSRDVWLCHRKTREAEQNQLSPISLWGPDNGVFVHPLQTWLKAHQSGSGSWWLQAGREIRAGESHPLF